jgi:hypothetical protein
MAAEETAEIGRRGLAPTEAAPLGRRATRTPAQRRDAVVAVLLGVLSGIGGGLLIYRSIKDGLISDYPAHLYVTSKLLHGGQPPGHFLFYLLDAAFAGFSSNAQRLMRSLAFVLGVAIAAKVWLAVRFVAVERRQASPTVGPLPLWAAGAATLCLLAFSLPVGIRHYIGQIPANVWHNSTEILLMPLAFALFWTTLRFLETSATRWLWWSLALVPLSLAAKPSFVLCLLPALAIVAPARLRWTKPLGQLALLVAVAVVLLAAQTAYVYVYDPQTASGGIMLRPFEVWNYFSASVPLSILASFIFPIAALTLGGAAVRAALAVRYASALLLCALAEFALLADRGAREFDGNLAWQAIVAMWILFIALVSALVPSYERRRIGTARQLLIAAALLVHVIAGVLYLQHWFATRNEL